ncbi:craniofacial development protein 2 [Elysia marginata]|uniref:Craniofacial development protein 2 n=1 Tax=Elysia marginata TaxID=1093978 RepID=A0AAV4H8M8_9GAST|nr:craniofacial development protein 2 [Elysia marginata]
MSMRLPLDKNQHLTLFSVYAPTLEAEPVEKDSFYSELGRLLTNTHAGDKVLILGDFNARFAAYSIYSSSPSLKGRVNLSKDLEKNLNALSDLDNPTPENLWDNLKSSILKSSEVTHGYTKRLHRDWFDENNQEVLDLLAQKWAAHQAHLAQPSCTAKKASFRHACTILQSKLRVMQNNWWEDLARITQQCADIGDYRRFYEALKTVYGPAHQIQSPLRNSDGQQLLTE